MKVAVLIDGGHLRAYAKKARVSFDPNSVIKVAKSCIDTGESLFRILYYDCAPFEGEIKLPVSATNRVFPSSNAFLDELSREELVAVRKGVLKFRGWERTRASLQASLDATNAGTVSPPLTDADFQPRFEQKGVDLRIGLDMMTMAKTNSVDLMIVMTGDTDLIPAFKQVRSLGFQVAGVNLPNYRLLPELKVHLDLFRSVPSW